MKIFLYKKTHTKRVIALPGETITINGTNIYIDGKLLEEPYAIYANPSEDYPFYINIILYISYYVIRR